MSIYCGGFIKDNINFLIGSGSCMMLICRCHSSCSDQVTLSGLCVLEGSAVLRKTGGGKRKEMMTAVRPDGSACRIWRDMHEKLISILYSQILVELSGAAMSCSSRGKKM